MFTRMTVSLSGKPGRLELAYAIRRDRIAQIWAESLNTSIEKSSLRDRDRIYNFPCGGVDPIQRLLDSLDQVVRTLKDFHPDLEFPGLDRSDLQNSVNKLHFNFAHAHHVMALVNPQNATAWNDFNSLLHAIELALNNEDVKNKSGIPAANIVFTWIDSPRVEIPEEAYEQFSLGFDFGVAYAGYCQTGRNFQEMFFSKDDQLDDAHIRPARVICGDTMMWFGPSFGDFGRRRTYLEMQQWFSERRERFNRLGFYWGDPRLALGRLPVARLIDAPYATKETLAFIHHMAQFDRLEAVEVTQS